MAHVFPVDSWLKQSHARRHPRKTIRRCDDAKIDAAPNPPIGALFKSHPWTISVDMGDFVWDGDRRWQPVQTSPAAAVALLGALRRALELRATVSPDAADIQPLLSAAVSNGPRRMVSEWTSTDSARRDGEERPALWDEACSRTRDSSRLRAASVSEVAAFLVRIQASLLRRANGARARRTAIVAEGHARLSNSRGYHGRRRDRRHGRRRKRTHDRK